MARRALPSGRPSKAGAACSHESRCCSCGQPRVRGMEFSARRARRAGIGTGASRPVNGSGTPLQRDTAQRFGSWFGHDFSKVRVHAGGEGGRISRRAGAVAWSSGGEIGFASGAYRPGTAWGDRLLAHELAHVVQQSRGVGRSSGVGRPGLEESAANRAASAWARGGTPPSQPAAPPYGLRFAPAPGAPAPAPPAAVPAAGPAAAGPVVALSPCTGPDGTAAAAAETKMGEWLTKAIQQLEGFVKAPADAAQAPVDAALHLHFHRADAEIGTAVADRLKRVQTAVGGGTGVQCADVTHPSCQAGADGFASPAAGTVGLCPLFFTESLDTQANTLLHEGMHLHGAAHSIPDRAYSHARYYSALTTEEAFDNADSFSNLVQDLILGAGSAQAGAAAPPVDTYRSCDGPQKDRLSRALGLAQKWLDPAFDAVTNPSLSSQALVQAEVTQFLGDATAATLQKASVAYAKVGKELVSNMSLVCEPPGANCPAGTALYHSSIRRSIYFCQEWFDLGTEELRARFLLDTLLQRFAGLHEVDSPHFVSLAVALLGITFAAPAPIPPLPGGAGPKPR